MATQNHNPPLSDTRLKGRQAEDQVAQYLKKKGALIVARNFRFPLNSLASEIDLIAFDRQRETLYLCEVKARKSLEAYPTLSLQQYRRLEVSKSLFQHYFFATRSLSFAEEKLFHKIFEESEFNKHFEVKKIESRLFYFDLKTQAVTVKELHSGLPF